MSEHTLEQMKCIVTHVRKGRKVIGGVSGEKGGRGDEGVRGEENEGEDEGVSWGGDESGPGR